MLVPTGQVKVPPPPLSTDQSFTKKLRSDHQVVDAQGGR